MDTQQAQIDELGDELAEYRSENKRDKALIRSDVNEATEQSDSNLSVIDAIAQKVKGFKSELRRMNGSRTPLEQVDAPG